MVQNPELADRLAQQEFFANVGLLFVTFAGFETGLTVLLKIHLNNQIQGDGDEDGPMQIAAAIYGSMRFKGARDTIKRIMEVDGTPASHKQAALDIFAHVGHIEMLRDQLAHSAVTGAGKPREKRWRVTDYFKTRNIAKPKTYEFTTEALKLAVEDLKNAMVHVNASRVIGGESIFTDQIFEPIAWRYKPSMLRLLPESSLDNPQGHPPPPSPSQA